MTTITILNAISCLLAALGIGGYLTLEERRARKTIVRPLYVTTGIARRMPHRRV